MIIDGESCINAISISFVENLKFSFLFRVGEEVGSNWFLIVTNILN